MNQRIVLLTFTWGTNSTAYYCSDTQPITLGTVAFLPEPSIEVTIDQQQGGAQDNPVTVRMRVLPPLDTLTTQLAHSKVTATIEEIDPSDVSTRRTLYQGVVRISRRNVNNMSGIGEVEIGGWRYMLEVAVTSWAANTNCNNTFGDPICKFDIASKTETATIQSIDGYTITLSGLTTTTRIGYWRYGSLTYDDLSILIRIYTTGSQMTLLKIPPASWQGKVVQVRPGCDKKVSTCIGFGRAESFTGFGLKVPAYNPYIEHT